MTAPPYTPEVENEKLGELSKIAPGDLTEEQLDYIFSVCEDSADAGAQIQAAALLSHVYSEIADANKDFAKRVHILYLKHLLKPNKEFGHPICNWLATTHLHGESLSGIPWESVGEVSTAAEALYDLTGSGLSSEEINVRVRDLVKYAGIGFADQDRWEDLFRLISDVHVAENTMDSDFYKLKNTVLLYERRRVVRLRRIMSNFVVGVLILVILISPSLFMLFENGYRAENGYQKLTFFDALYWSIITAGTVGYGDIVPYTIAGRMLAMADSLLVIVLLGVVAGIILSHLTPRNV
jgi:Ion channel